MVASTIRWGLIQLKMILWYDCPWSLAPTHFHLHCHLRLLTFTLWCHHVLPQQPGLEHPALHPELQHPGLHRPWLHSPRLQGLVQMWEVLWLKSQVGPVGTCSIMMAFQNIHRPLPHNHILDPGIHLRFRGCKFFHGPPPTTETNVFRRVIPCR